MELQQIRYFLAAAESLNFTRAAKLCGVSQPALTQAIQKLEEDLGGSLFQRERNHTHLTELGRVMRDRLSAVSDQASAAKEAARRLLRFERATLNLGVMCTIGAARLVNFMARFKHEQPGVEINLFDIKLPESVDDLLSGGLDVALLGLPTKVHERFDTTLLYSERLVVIFPPEHRFSRFKEVPLMEFAGERYLDRLDCEFRPVWFDALRDGAIEIQVPYRSEREDWIQYMVRAGLGVAIVPEFSVCVDVLDYRPITDPVIERTVEVVTVAGRLRSPALSAFMESIVSEFRNQ